MMGTSARKISIVVNLVGAGPVPRLAETPGRLLLLLDAVARVAAPLGLDPSLRRRRRADGRDARRRAEVHRKQVSSDHGRGSERRRQRER